MIKKQILLIIFFASLLKGQDCVLVHGWMNTGSVWDGSAVKNLVLNEYDFGRILQPTIGGDKGILSASDQSLIIKYHLRRNMC